MVETLWVVEELLGFPNRVWVEPTVFSCMLFDWPSFNHLFQWYLHPRQHVDHRPDLESDPAIWRFCKLPLNDTRDPDAPAIDFRYYIVRPRRFWSSAFHIWHQQCSKIYLRLSVRLLSSFPSHAISFFLTDIDCDLHQWSGPFSCSFLICSISYPSMIALSTAVCLPLFSGVIDFLWSSKKRPELRRDCYG